MYYAIVAFNSYGTEWLRSTSSLSIIEDLIPTASISSNLTEIDQYMSIQFESTVSSGDEPISYHWDFGDGSSYSSEQTPEHQYTTAGTFTVTMTVEDKDGDISTETMEVVVNSVSINEDGDEDDNFSEEHASDGKGVDGLPPLLVIVFACLGIGFIVKKTANNPLKSAKTPKYS